MRLSSPIRVLPVLASVCFAQDDLSEAHCPKTLFLHWFPYNIICCPICCPSITSGDFPCVDTTAIGTLSECADYHPEGYACCWHDVETTNTSSELLNDNLETRSLALWCLETVAESAIGGHFVPAAGWNWEGCSDDFWGPVVVPGTPCDR